MSNIANESLINQCYETIENAIECIKYYQFETIDETERTRLNILFNECSAFVSERDLFIDNELKNFTNTETLYAFTESLKQLALEVFNDRFALQRFRAIDLALQLEKAGSQICIYNLDDLNRTLH